MSLPSTLVEAVRYFSDPDVGLNFVAGLVWTNGVPTCPKCSGQATYYLKPRRIWKCKTCSKQFSVRNGTIMEDSHLSLDKWLVAIWAIANAKNGISSWELHRAIGVTQKTAWFLLHRVRVAMRNRSLSKLSGEVEADETYIGGLAENMHEYRRKVKIHGTGGVGKTIVMGLLQRHGEVRTEIVPNTKRPVVQARVRKHVEPGSELFTDQLASYQGLAPDFVHQVINHQVVSQVTGRRLTYRELTGKEEIA